MYGINRLTCIPDSTAKIQTSLQTKNNSLSFFAVRPCLRNFAPNMIFNCKGTTLFSITKQSGGNFLPLSFIRAGDGVRGNDWILDAHHSGAVLPDVFVAQRATDPFSGGVLNVEAVAGHLGDQELGLAIQIDGEDGRVVGLEIEGVTPYRHSVGFIDDPLVPVCLIPSSGIGADVINHEESAVGRELPIPVVDITCVPIGFLYFDCLPLSHEHLRGLLFRGGTVGLVVAAGGGEQGGHRAERRQECEMKFCFHD